MKKKFVAFTLAEVLITLGIIGIVAALTLPAFIAKYQEKVRSEQLKTSYSILSQGFSKMLADDGVTDFSETSYATKLSDSNLSEEDEIEIFKKYFKTVVTVPYKQQVEENWPSGNAKYTGDICKKYAGKGSTWYLKGGKQCQGLRQTVYKLNNGALVRMSFCMYHYKRVENKGNLKQIIAELTVDVNGEQEPNTFGEDAFSFVVGQDGKLYPIGGKDFAYYVSTKNGGNFENYYYKKNGVDLCETGNGKECVAGAMEHNWDIHYYKKNKK